MFRRTVIAFVVALTPCMATSSLAQMKGGMGSGMGSGMIITADDGSILVTRIGTGMMSSQQRALVNINADGSIRWKLDFTDR